MKVIDRQMIVSYLQQVSEHGRYHRACCPFHDDHDPSLLVYDDGFRCLAASCGRFGSLDTLWEKVKGLTTDSRQSVVRCRVWPFHGMSLDEIANEGHHTLKKMPVAARYLKSRGIEARIDFDRLGWLMGWYTFPFLDEDGSIIGLSARAGPTIDSRVITRYVVNPAWKGGLYIPRQLDVLNPLSLVLVYGTIDAVYLAHLGFRVASWVPGVFAKTDAFKAYRCNIFVIPDKGEEKYGNRLVRALGWRGNLVELKYPRRCKDVNDFYQVGAEDELLRQLKYIFEER